VGLRWTLICEKKFANTIHQNYIPLVVIVSPRSESECSLQKECDVSGIQVIHTKAQCVCVIPKGARLSMCVSKRKEKNNTHTYNKLFLFGATTTTQSQLVFRRHTSRTRVDLARVI